MSESELLYNYLISEIESGGQGLQLGTDPYNNSQLIIALNLEQNNKYNINEYVNIFDDYYSEFCSEPVYSKFNKMYTRHFDETKVDSVMRKIISEIDGYPKFPVFGDTHYCNYEINDGFYSNYFAYWYLEDAIDQIDLAELGMCYQQCGFKDPNNRYLHFFKEFVKAKGLNPSTEELNKYC